jgi:hypothetical protein
MINTKSSPTILPVTLFAVTLALAAPSAQAFTVACATTFCVDEYFVPSLNQGWFNVTNNTASELVVAFAVANDTATYADGMSELQGEWAAGTIQAAAWDASKGAFEAGYGITVPTFAMAFSGYSQALVYWAVDLLSPGESAAIDALPWNQRYSNYYDPPAQISAPVLFGTSSGWETEGWGFGAVSAASPFLVLSVDLSTGSFNLTQGETSVTTPVPLPAGAWLLASALGAIGFHLRSRRTR